MPIGASLYCWHTSFGAMFRYMLHKNLSGQNIATCYDKWFIWTKFIWAKAFMFWILMFILQCITKIIEPSKFEFFLLYSRHEKLICKAFNSPPKLWSSLLKKEIWKLFEVHQAFEFCSWGTSLGCECNLHSVMDEACNHSEITLLHSFCSHWWCPNADPPQGLAHSYCLHDRLLTE